MSFLRSAIVLALGASSAQLLLFACATSEERAAPGGPASDANVSPESALENDVAIPEDAAGDSPSPSTCSDGGFCYTPIPDVGPVRDISAASIDDAWAVTSSSILRWDGTTWTQVHHSNEVRFVGVWATTSNDAWFLAFDALVETSPQLRLVRYSALDGSPPAIRSVSTPSFTYGYTPSAHPVFWGTPSSDALWLLDYEPDAQHPDLEHALDVAVFREAPDGAMTMDRLPLPVDPGNGGSYQWASLWGFGMNDVYVGGSVCPREDCTFEPQDYQGAIAHYDGTGWSVTVLDDSKPVLEMYGTAPSSRPRQLWLGLGLQTYGEVCEPRTLRLVPIADDGSIGAPLHDEHFERETNPTCGCLAGSVTSSSAAWFSDACLVYRWNGTDFEIVPTALGAIPTGRVDGIWAPNADEAWIVGQTLDSSPVLRGFAAKRSTSRNGTTP